jgi:hypothetical protein
MPKDIMDREIEAGHVIVYPVRKGSQMWLKKLEVSRVDELKRTLHGMNTMGVPVTIKNLNTVAVVDANL